MGRWGKSKKRLRKGEGRPRRHARIAPPSRKDQSPGKRGGKKRRRGRPPMVHYRSSLEEEKGALFKSANLSSGEEDVLWKKELL